MLKNILRAFSLAVVFVLLSSTPALACSVFFVADSNQAYFCSNEDGENGNTYLWFLPAAKGTYGAVFFSYEDAWVQGGMNEKGLALDWATTEPQQMDYYPDRQSPIGNKYRLYFGNLNETILKSCATLEDVTAIYNKYNEMAFKNAHVLVADKNGASAIFEWHDGKFEVIKRTASYEAITNFNLTNAATNGYSCSRYDAIKGQLGNNAAVSFDTAKNALMLASDSLTQYSYICDLKNGVVTVFDKRNFSQGKNFMLSDELAKDAHIDTTSMGAFNISRKYRLLGSLNNQNPLAVGSGRIEIWAACLVGVTLAMLSVLFVKKNRIYLLPVFSDLILIPMGLGLMRYGYFLRYGFTFGQKLLLALPILFVLLAAVEAVCAVVLLTGKKKRSFILFTINTAISVAIAIALLLSVMF